ncbi:MAG: hypothetical protein ACHREM_20120 [Polyangiales bacterium]
MPSYAVRRNFSSSANGPGSATWRGYVERLSCDRYATVRLSDSQASDLARTGLVDIHKLSDSEPTSDTSNDALTPKELESVRDGVSRLRGLVDGVDTAKTLIAIRDTVVEILPLLERYGVE